MRVRPVTGCVEREHVVQIEADHLGVDQVVAVVRGRRSICSVSVSLAWARSVTHGASRRRSSGQSSVPRPPSTASASRHHASTSSSSGRAVRCDVCADSKCSAVTIAGERLAQHLAALTEGRLDQRKQRIGIGRRWFVAGDLDQRGLDVRSRHEDRSRDDADHAGRAPVRGLHADGAVRRGAGRGGEPLGHLALDHHEDAREPAGRNRAHRRRVVSPRCTADWRRAPSRRRAESSRRVSPSPACIASPSTTSTFARSATTCGGPGRCPGRLRPR